MPSPPAPVLLALDTSGSVAAAVAVDGVVVASRLRHDPRRHAELLLPFVDEVLAEAGVDRRSVDVVAVGTGPGPFTGLRVGLVTARAVALALGVPVHGVPSLDALAADVVERGLVPDGAAFGVATDARRREVYWGSYRQSAAGDAERLSGPAVTRPADVDARGLPWFGRGAALYPEVLVPAAAEPLDVSAAVLARLAARQVAAGVGGDDAPLYLRRPDAVEPAARKKVTT